MHVLVYGAGTDKSQEDYLSYLKSLYKMKSQASYLEESEWLCPVSDHVPVCRLAMIMAKKVDRKHVENDFVRKTITGKVDDILQEKVPIELKDIFSKIEKEKRRKVLLEGAPGSGKSTLSLHICHQWAEGNLFPEYKKVILVRLRDQKVQQAQNITDLLPRRDKGMAQKIEVELSASDGKDILFILDGWDELPHKARGRSVIIDILKSTNYDVIITSRPTSSMSLHRLGLMNVRIEILGFASEELKNFFTKRLGNDTKSVETLEQRIQENPVIAGTSYLPLNASIIVYLFKFHDNDLPTTLFGIFDALTRNYVFRHLKKRKQVEIKGIKDLEKLPTPWLDRFKDIRKLAYDGISEDRIIFGLDGDFETLGLLQGVESFIDCGTSHSYNFLHLSIQEMLAALYMASVLKPREQVEQFKTLFGRPRFSAVFQFYAAKTKLRTDGISEIVTMVVEKCLQDNRMTELTSDPKPSTSDSNFGHQRQPLLLCLIHCLFEAHDKTLCQSVVQQLGSKLDLRGISLSPADCVSLRYFLAHCTDFVVDLQLCDIGDEGCKCLFKKNECYPFRAL